MIAARLSGVETLFTLVFTKISLNTCVASVLPVNFWGLLGKKPDRVFKKIPNTTRFAKTLYLPLYPFIFKKSGQAKTKKVLSYLSVNVFMNILLYYCLNTFLECINLPKKYMFIAIFTIFRNLKKKIPQKNYQTRQKKFGW